MVLKYTSKQIIEKFKNIHGNKYDYKHVEYTGTMDYITIICNIHGKFRQTANSHLNGNGCRQCACIVRNEKNRYSKSAVLKKFRIAHPNNDYDYKYMKLVNLSTDIVIKHKICGTKFKQTPASHILGSGCLKCSYIKRGIKHRLTSDNFKKISMKVHNNRYDYRRSKYADCKSKLIIICKKCEQSFKQTPDNHMRGKGCPNCKISKGELSIYDFLQSQDIKFVFQKRFNKCKNIKILPIDIFIKSNTVIGKFRYDNSICIEPDGIQHTRPVKYFGGLKRFIIQVKNDSIKNKYCREREITLIRIPHTVNDVVEFLLDRLVNWTKDKLDNYNILLEKQQQEAIKKYAEMGWD